MAPKGLYSVQKSRSFGGSHNFHDTPPKDQQPLSPEQGRKTPNFDSLRKKFSKKKTTSFDDDDGDIVDGNTLTLKKKNRGPSKVGNIFKWFRKDSKDHETFYEQDTLTPKITRLIQKQNEEPCVISVNPRPFRSCSFDSICSVGSTASSFAFVPVNAYKVGRYVEPKKKIPLGINCGPETYRKRLEPRDNPGVIDTDKELTLKTKYNLMSSDSPPTLAKKLPAGPLLASSELHRNDDTNSSSGGSDSDTDTAELESVSQRGSPVSSAAAGSWPAAGARSDQQPSSGPADAAQPQHCIKPRQLTGQLLHPMTIRHGEDNKRAAGAGPRCAEAENVAITSPVRPPPPVRHFAPFAQLECANNSGGRAADNLPKYCAAEAAPRSVSPGSSPRLSVSSGDSDPRSAASHIPGKRRAPPPPAISPEPGSRETEANNPFVKKKGRAPQPPEDKVSSSSTAAAAGAECQGARPPAVGDTGARMAGGSSEAVTSAPTSPLLASKRSPGAGDWVLQDGLLRCTRDSQQDLAQSCAAADQELETKDAKDAKVPLSPKPWYKRNIIKENSDKKAKEKKAKSPDNLPENHTSRDTVKVKDDDKYGFTKLMADAPKSPKMFLRNKMMPGSPKAERPGSRPISGLTGISDLDRQAAEIIRRKNEDEAAKRRADDDKFYANKVESEGREAQKAIDAIMEKMARRVVPQKEKLEAADRKNDLTKSPKSKKKDADIEVDFQSMGNVVSDLNSFLASTRKAMSSPSAQKRIQQQLQQPVSNPLQQQSSASPVIKEQPQSSLNPQHQAPNSINPKPTQVSQSKLQQTTSTQSQQHSQNQESNNNLSKSKKDFELKTSQVVSGQNGNNSKIVKGGYCEGSPAEQKLMTEHSNTLSATDQKVNYVPPSVSEYKPSCPPPPPPSHEWSCQRCTLINSAAAAACEVCGASRPGDSGHGDAEDTQGEEAPPRPGNVLNKLVLFSSIDAKAKETPTLQRRKSSEIMTLSRTQSSIMFPIDENPLQRTLERITEKQAALAKTKDCFNNNFSTSKDANVEKCKLNSSPCQSAAKSNIKTEVMTQQQNIQQEANLNLSKQKQQEEKFELNEKTSTLPFGNVSSKITTTNSDNCVSNENSGINQNNLIMRSSSVIIPSQSNKEIENISKPLNASPTVKGSFDFTKTPGSFLTSSKISQPTPRPWTKFVHEDTKTGADIKAAPKLEFLGSEVTRKYSVPDSSELRQARIEFFSGQKKDEDKSIIEAPISKV